MATPDPKVFVAVEPSFFTVLGEAPLVGQNFTEQNSRCRRRRFLLWLARVSGGDVWARASTWNRNGCRLIRGRAIVIRVVPERDPVDSVQRDLQGAFGHRMVAAAWGV